MIRGITPIDTAFELMGLHQAQAIVRFVFMETLGGKLIFAFGFILSLGAWLRQGSFRPLFGFLIMFFSLWFLLVLPRTKAADAVSSMERHGYQELTAMQVLKKNGYGEIRVDQLMDATSRWVDALTSGATAALERMSGERGYLASPFLFCKVSVLTSSIIDRGITDPKLEEDLAHFYQDHFWPAVRKLPPQEGLWPGAEVLRGAYIEEGRAAWQALRERLYAFCDHEKIFTRMFARFYDGRTDKDAVVQALLAQELRSRPERYTLFSYPSQERLQAPDFSKSRWDILLPQMIFEALPFIQGGALFFLWSSFAFFLAAALIIRQMMPLFVFLGTLFVLKAWTFIWALIDKVSMTWFALRHGPGGVELWQAPAVNVGSALAALIVPLAVMMVVVSVSIRSTRRSV